MKNNHVNFTEGEITLYCGENAVLNNNESLKHASAIASRKPKENILFLNTFLSARKIMAAERTYAAEKAGKIKFQNIQIGELANQLWRLEDTIRQQKITCVIINSWEFAHKSYTCKERAFFELMGLVHELGISLLIYSQAKAAEPGKMQRGGLGKLSAVADAIISVETESDDAKNEKLIDRKINELEYARSESGISEEGELILPVNKVRSGLSEKEEMMAGAG